MTQYIEVEITYSRYNPYDKQWESTNDEVKYGESIPKVLEEIAKPFREDAWRKMWKNKKPIYRDDKQGKSHKVGYLISTGRERGDDGKMYKTRMWISFSKMTSEFPEFR
jgi:hypothetical protein